MQDQRICRLTVVLACQNEIEKRCHPCSKAAPASRTFRVNRAILSPEEVRITRAPKRTGFANIRLESCSFHAYRSSYNITLYIGPSISWVGGGGQDDDADRILIVESITSELHHRNRRTTAR